VLARAGKLGRSKVGLVKYGFRKVVDDFVRGGKLGRNPEWLKISKPQHILNAIIVKFVYGSRSLQVEVHLITYKNYTLQSISHLGVRPHRHVYTTMTQQNIAYNWNIINVSTLTHALLLVVPRPTIPPHRPTLPKPSLPKPCSSRLTLRGPSLPTPVLAIK